MNPALTLLTFLFIGSPVKRFVAGLFDKTFQIYFPCALGMQREQSVEIGGRIVHPLVSPHDIVTKKTAPHIVYSQLL